MLNEILIAVVPASPFVAAFGRLEPGCDPIRANEAARTAFAIQAAFWCRAYFPWQQLSVQPSLQQVWPHLSLQQLWQAMPFAIGVCARAAMASNVPNESNAKVRFMIFSLTLKCVGLGASV